MTYCILLYFMLKEPSALQKRKLCKTLLTAEWMISSLTVAAATWSLLILGRSLMMSLGVRKILYLWRKIICWTVSVQYLSKVGNCADSSVLSLIGNLIVWDEADSRHVRGPDRLDLVDRAESILANQLKARIRLLTALFQHFYSLSPRQSLRWSRSAAWDTQRPGYWGPTLCRTRGSWWWRRRRRRRDGSSGCTTPAENRTSDLAKSGRLVQKC